MSGWEELYNEAVKRERQSRDAAFLGICEKIGPVSVSPFTLRKLNAISLINSPFLRFKDDLDNEQLTELVYCEYITRTDCAIFLWNVSTRFRPLVTWWDRFQYRRFMRSQAKADTVKTASLIFAYLREAFEDSPASSGKNSVSYYSVSASLVDWILSEYGGKDDDVLDMPLKRIWQYTRAIGHRTNSKAPMFNRSDKVKGDYLRSKNKK